MAEFNPTEVHQGLLDILPQYTRIDDCLDGSDKIKSKGTDYLPKPDPTNESDKNATRYDQYLERAIFYPITGRTVSGMVGLVFSKPQPEFELPEQLSYIKKNIDGSGITLEQQVKKVIFACSSIGRSGLLVDYSKTNGEVSQQAVNSGNVRASITRYEAINLIWAEYKQIGIESILSLVIIYETYTELSDDGYKSTTGNQYKVLSIKDGVYHQEIFRTTEKKSSYELSYELSSVPKGFNDKPLTRIPFTFVGSMNNDIYFDNPPMLGVADLNIGHYVNSADNEEASHVAGQPTYVISGLTKTWLSDVLGGEVHVGSRGGIPLPEGGSASLLQAAPNTLPAAGMETKEKQMAAIGAQLVVGSSGIKTATEINRDSTVEDSVLSTIAHNVEQAYNFCFEQVSIFTGIALPEFGLNKEFNFETFDPNKYTSLVNGSMQGVNTKEEPFNYLKKTGMIAHDTDFESWNGLIDNQIPGVV